MAKVVINGFGRIGRLLYRSIVEDTSLEVVAINDLVDEENLKYLLKHDSAHGSFEGPLEEVEFLSEKDPSKLPWDDVDLVFECTGFFTSREGAEKHLEAGAEAVIISANADGVPHAVFGVNEEEVADEKIIAACSCTTNSAVPVMKVLDDNFGIEKAQLLTVHAVTANQNLVDGPHSKDWRRGRSALNNIVPTTTGSDEAIERVLPSLKGKISGSAMRVPVISGSILQVVANISKEATREEVNDVFRGSLEGVLKCSEEPLVSTDIIGTKKGSIVDLNSTEVIGNLVKVLAWYDNESAYSYRLSKLGEYIA